MNQEWLELVIMATSVKNRGYCVAGIDTTTHEWIRLVSSDRDSKGAIPEDWLWYDDGTKCKPLDVVQAHILGAVSRQIILTSSISFLRVSMIVREYNHQHHLNI